MKTPTKEMTWLEKVSFGCGNMGLCLCTTMITSFSMYFYSNVMGLTMAQISTIMLIGGIADAISDPLTGIFIDKTNTRWGKARPYLLVFAIPLAAACYAVFTVPNMGPDARYIYALVTYVLYTLAYTLICIPQNCLIPALTDNSKDRLDVNMCGTLGTNIGQFIPSGLGLTLVAILGGGSEESGFSRAILLLSVLGVLLILMDFKNTNERCNPPKEQKATLRDILRSMKNLPWFLCTCVSLLVIATVVVRASQAVYFATYVLENPGLASPLLSISSVIGIPVALVIPFLNLLSVILLAAYGDDNGTKTKVTAKDLLRTIITSPVILGTIVGIIWNPIQHYLFAFPACINSVFTTLGSMSTVLLLIAVGGTINLENMKNYGKEVAKFTPLAMVVKPLVSCLIMMALGFTGTPLVLGVLIMGTPAPVATVGMAVAQKRDGVYAGLLVSVCSLISVLTLFLFIFGLGSLGLVTYNF